MTDIWAFGMTIYELISRNVPYYDQKVDSFVISTIIFGQLPDKPKPDEASDPIVFNSLWDVCRACWLESPSRPTALHIRDFLCISHNGITARIARLVAEAPKHISRHRCSCAVLYPIPHSRLPTVQEPSIVIVPVPRKRYRIELSC